MKGIYLDNAAATPIDPRVIGAMNHASRLPGNPSSFNDAGRKAAQVLQKARQDVARFLNAHESEIVFCSSGSEANNLALAGATRILTQSTEHRSVLQAAGERARIVSAEDIFQTLDTKMQIVSIMYANNEIGTIYPIAKIARAIAQWRKEHRSSYPLLHVDACQAAAYLPMDVQSLGVDLMTFNGSKVYGPRGIAVLYVRRGVELMPQVLGGSQERGRRAGTEHVPAIVGLAKALSLIKKSDAVKVAKLRDYFLQKISTVIPDAHLNGPTGDDRLANNINISIPGTDSENLLLELDKYDIWAGSGSACTAHSVEPSHVLKAISTPKKYLDGVLRFSLSRHTTKADIDRVLKVFPQVVKAVRKRKMTS